MKVVYVPTYDCNLIESILRRTVSVQVELLSV